MSRASKPLATSWRFAYGTRGDGQVRNETTRYLQLNLGRTFRFGQQSVEAGVGINVFNTGAHTQWTRVRIGSTTTCTSRGSIVTRRALFS